MTYQFYEDSVDLGTPVELYEFQQGSLRWQYISGASALTLLGQRYTPLPLQRDRIKQSQDIFKNGLKLSFPREDLFANQFIGFSPEDITSVTIRRGHWGDPSSEFVVYWRGRISGAIASDNTIHLECESIFTSLRRPGLRAKFEYGCRHVHYGAGCLVSREPYSAPGNVVGVDRGIVLEVPQADLQPDGYYSGGLLVSPLGVSRFITDHVGVYLTITRPSFDLIVGSAVTIYPGCDHTKETCLNKFGNLDNFGGFPWIPNRNPFDGSSIA